jgi:LPXTG-motif cell wall-anchored protein
VSPTGVIALGEKPAGVTFESRLNSDGSVSNILTIENVKSRNVSFKKVDVANTDVALAGAKFDLYKVVNGERVQPALISGLISGEDGMLAKNGQKTFALAPGTYHLVETKAPNGYNLKTDPVIVVVTAAGGESGVTYNDGTSHSTSGKGRTYDADEQLYTLEITNSAGYALPNTGGFGTLPFTVVGTLLMLAATVLFARARRAR